MENSYSYMRMYENFSGCRVLAYCLMCNHVHLLLEAPPMPVGGLSDAELLKRLGAIYPEVEVSLVGSERFASGGGWVMMSDNFEEIEQAVGQR